MNENNNYLKNYDSISEDVKFIANSIIRLKILSTLYEKPQNMKELASATKLSYSSISSTLHGLELKDFVYRESTKYHLSNSLKVQMKNVIELKEVVNLLNRLFNIIDGHVLDMIPNQSVEELYLLGKVELLESDRIDAYNLITFIEDALRDAGRVRAILPFYHLTFNQILNDLVKNDMTVEIMVSEEILEIYEDNSDVKYMSSFKGKNNFLLIVTDKAMILGLFKEEGQFDQNRLLVSKNNESLKWANNLFKNFKKKKLNE